MIFCGHRHYKHTAFNWGCYGRLTHSENQYHLRRSRGWYCNISFQKKCSSKYVVKNARNVTTFFYWISRVCKKKKELNIYTRILDIMKLEQIHFMVVKIESYVWEKNCNIWSPLLYGIRSNRHLVISAPIYIFKSAP
jgi:hypothetical protein